jgi:hypothetical protein
LVRKSSAPWRIACTELEISPWPNPEARRRRVVARRNEASSSTRWIIAGCGIAVSDDQYPAADNCPIVIVHLNSNHCLLTTDHRLPVTNYQSLNLQSPICHLRRQPQPKRRPARRVVLRGQMSAVGQKPGVLTASLDHGKVGLCASIFGSVVFSSA